MQESNRKETSFETACKVVDLIRSKNMCNIHVHDIDIAHRLPQKINNCRVVIVKLHSRYAKDMILRNAKNLKGTGIFVNEDLTRKNQHVLMCMKKKSPDDVQIAWSRNGSLFYKDKQDHIKFVPYEEYQDWVDLPWPKKISNKTDTYSVKHKTSEVNVD